MKGVLVVYTSELSLSRVVEEPTKQSLQAWMLLGAADIGGYELITQDDLNQRFSLAPYIRMSQIEGVNQRELASRFEEDAITYVEENVLKVKLGQRNFTLRDGDMYSDKFGEKSFLTMCRDTVVAREQKGLNADRARHEGLGVANIVKLLEVSAPGQVVVLISPPDKTDKNMADYSMIYLYSKEENNTVWFGAVRDENRQIDDWQDFAQDQSMWQTDWRVYDHLKFVALPIAVKSGLHSVLDALGVSHVTSIPNWIKREAHKTAEMIAANIAVGNRSIAQKILDAFKMAVITGRHQTDDKSTGISVASIVMDYRYAWMIQQRFNNEGGQNFISAGGACGVDKLMNSWNSSFFGTEQDRGQNIQSDMFGINEKNVARTGELSTSSSSSDEIHINKDGMSYVLKIREGWKCVGEGCGRISSHASKVRIGICHICEYCDPNVHRGD